MASPHIISDYIHNSRIAAGNICYCKVRVCSCRHRFAAAYEHFCSDNDFCSFLFFSFSSYKKSTLLWQHCIPCSYLQRFCSTNERTSCHRPQLQGCYEFCDSFVAAGLILQQQNLTLVFAAAKVVPAKCTISPASERLGNGKTQLAASTLELLHWPPRKVLVSRISTGCLYRCLDDQFSVHCRIGDQERQGLLV